LPITRQELDAHGAELAAEVRPWDSGSFAVVRKLQDAPMNSGSVHCMLSRERASLPVAVKQMPNHWVTSSPEDFKAQHPKVSEQPWFDLAALRLLNRRRCPYVCELLGVYRCEEMTYVVTSLASEGDLFGYCRRLPRPGPSREMALRSIAWQLFCAVSWLHERGLAHGDLSLENIVLSDDGHGELRVKLIDFGMGTVSSLQCRGRASGKQVYLAPEVYSKAPYDPYSADSFALGVVLFAAAVEDYPWASAKPGACKSFQYCSTHGFLKLLRRRKAPSGGAGCLAAVFSRELAELLEGMLWPQPEERLSVCLPVAQLLPSLATSGAPAEGPGGEQTAEDFLVDGSVWAAPWLYLSGGSQEAHSTKGRL